MKNILVILLLLPLVSFGQTAEDFFNNGKVKDSLKDFKGAISDYSKAIELNPDNADYYYRRGNAKYFSDDDKGSIVDFNKAIELNPDNADYYYRRGNAKNYLEDYEGAIADYTKAIELYTKAIELNPDNADYYDRRGNTKNYLEDYEGAIADYTKAIELRPDFALYYNHLGDALEKIKKYKEAKVQYVIAEKLDPSGDALNYNTAYYYPYFLLEDEEDLKFPIEADVELFIEDIFNFDTKNDQFFLRFKYMIYSPYPADYITNQIEGNNISDIRENVKVDYINSDQTKASELVYDSIKNSLGYMYEGSLESSFYHNWDLRDYPFDDQKVQVRFKSSLDSTIFKFNESEKFPATFNKKMVGLKDGYKIKEITFNTDYTNGWEELSISPTLRRNIIYPIGVFNIIVSREGSWLFIKLFLGSILSFIISWIVFLIPKEEFDSRISLTVGGIFGAIGNRYFVDSTIPPVQFLTKADMINNMILALLILNVLIVIVQKNNKINFGLLEQNKFAMFFTGIAFVVLNTLIVLW
jgi:tetratricopeptide (TPR) repeat protein